MHENIHLTLRRSDFVMGRYRRMLDLPSDFGESLQCRILGKKKTVERFVG
jgi:hypothetical protein